MIDKKFPYGILFLSGWARVGLALCMFRSGMLCFVRLLQDHKRIGWTERTGLDGKGKGATRALDVLLSLLWDEAWHALSLTCVNEGISRTRMIGTD